MGKKGVILSEAKDLVHEYRAGWWRSMFRSQQTLRAAKERGSQGHVFLTPHTTYQPLLLRQLLEKLLANIEIGVNPLHIVEIV
ncbi:hypothetical protein BMS3Bbin04_00884 [bacterium BMS3Bbin04]|nr:hypothetical protein BMS3Bbin04_00884 [bacterium BMS3Bbin04]